MPNLQSTIELVDIAAQAHPAQHDKCSCSHEGWQHSTAGNCNVIGCDCEQHDGGKKMKAGGPGSGRHKILTDLAEKVGKERTSTRSLTFDKSEDHDKYKQSQDRIKQHMKDAGVEPKELAKFLTKQATSVGRRVNVNWLKNM